MGCEATRVTCLLGGAVTGLTAFATRLPPSLLAPRTAAVPKPAAAAKLPTVCNKLEPSPSWEGCLS